MRFGPVHLDEAEGMILGHNVAGPDGKRVLRKGKTISAEDVAALRALSRTTVYAAELEPGDLTENQAASDIAQALSGRGLKRSQPVVGRVNLTAERSGILRVDVEGLRAVNEIDGVTVASLSTNEPVQEAQIVATVKIVPYGIPESALSLVEMLDSEQTPVLRVDPFRLRRVAVIFFATPEARNRVQAGFERPIRDRINELDGEITSVEFVPLEDMADELELASGFDRLAANGAELIILAGETAIMDRHDIAPRAVERAGGRVIAVGVPVDPGNLLMLAYLDQVPVLGAPGCIRSRKKNVVDLLLPRLLAGDRLSRSDLIGLGHGGLLEDTAKRPMPRSRI